MIDCTAKVLDWTGEAVTKQVPDGIDPVTKELKTKDQIVPLGQIIAAHVANSTQETDTGVRAFVIATRLHDGGKKVELGGTDLALVLKAIEEQKVATWLKASCKYLVDSASITDKDALEALDSLYGRNGKSKTK